MVRVPQRSIAVAKAEDQSWRGRTVMACGVMATGIMALGAAHLDWGQDPATSLGQLAGMAAPLAALSAAVWGVCAYIGRKA